MRNIAAGVLILLLCAAVVAQDDHETPTQSFQKFMDAVLSETMSREDQDAVFERYFDFDTWLKTSETERGEAYPEEERAKLKDGWMSVFRSAEFRERFTERQVQIGPEATIDREAGTATLPITMGEKKFEVRMTLSADGTYWRWYSIPLVSGEPQPMTPEERLKALEESLTRIQQERERLDRLEDAVRRELAKLRAEKAEADTGSSPKAVVTAAWAAVEKGDVDALLDCHTTAQVAKSKLADVKAGVDKTRERLMEWTVLQATIDEDDDTRATVPVRLKLRRTGEPDERTISVRVVKVGDQWKIDEAP